MRAEIKVRRGRRELWREKNEENWASMKNENRIDDW